MKSSVESELYAKISWIILTSKSDYFMRIQSFERKRMDSRGNSAEVKTDRSVSVGYPFGELEQEARRMEKRRCT